VKQEGAHQPARSLMMLMHCVTVLRPGAAQPGQSGDDDDVDDDDDVHVDNDDDNRLSMCLLNSPPSTLVLSDLAQH
jgi:hypothetical protein